jgi:hypothetical protein
MAQLRRAPIVDGADLSLGAFLLMPLFAAVLSIAMWTRLPTWEEAFEARRPLVEARRDVFGRLATLVPTEPVQASRCTRVLSPPPHFDAEDDAGTNVAILSPQDLSSMHLPRRLNGEELYLSGRVMYLVLFATSPPYNPQRMSRARIAAEIEQPIQNNRYVMFYGTADVPFRPGAGGNLKVDAFLFDVSTGERVCDLTVMGWRLSSVDTGRQLVTTLDAAAAAAATGRPKNR